VEHAQDASRIPHRDLDVALSIDPAAGKGALALLEAAAHGVEHDAAHAQPVEIIVQDRTIEPP
jgi:hypothetical protein